MKITIQTIILGLIFLGMGCSPLINKNNTVTAPPVMANEEEMETVEQVQIPSSNSLSSERLNPETISIPIPSNFSLLMEATGEINGHSIKAIVYDTNIEVDFGTQRELRIYRWFENQWQLWGSSNSVVLSSQSGGILGDSFDQVTIENDAVVISHFGGSRQKWNYTHNYMNINNEWKLTEATVVYGSPCDYFDNFDYDLTSGEISYSREIQVCGNDYNPDNAEIITESSSFIQKVDTLPSMSDFTPGKNEVEIAGADMVIFY